MSHFNKEVHLVKSEKLSTIWTVVFFAWTIFFTVLLFILYQTELKAQSFVEGSRAPVAEIVLQK